MFRFYIALLSVLFSINSLFAKVYPSSGALFDVYSSQCAIGRPLNEVLDEMTAQTSFISKPGDYLTVNTSSNQQKTYYSSNVAGNHFDWPSLSSTDTLMFVSSIEHYDRPNGGLADTVTTFGVSFEPGTTMSERKVKTFWMRCGAIFLVDSSKCVSGVTYHWCEHDSQDLSDAALYSSPYFINNYFENTCFEDCPTPNTSYNYSSRQFKTGKNRASFVYQFSAVGVGDTVRYCIWDVKQCLVGNFNYCPVIEEVYDTVCRAELPGRYNTKLTHSGADTLVNEKTWYGADSLIILHLIVNEPSYTEVDSFRCSNEVTKKTLETSTVTYTSAAGCDSVVTYHVTIFPSRVVNDVYETLCRGDLPGSYETSLTHSGIDTLVHEPTWYGADSAVVLHLVVNEPSEVVVDSVFYSNTATDTSYEVVTDVLVNAAGCDSVVTYNVKIVPLKVPVIPDKYFTPNGDGISDVWNIKNINLYKKYTVIIFNRDGKKLMAYKGNFYGWDGYYNGNPQPSTDYWFSISIDEIDESLTGHFTLIR